MTGLRTAGPADGHPRTEHALTAVRTLPLRVGIAEGESVDSWIERLARRHKIAPRPLLPVLGLPPPTRVTFTNRLIYGIDPALWRRVEQATGLQERRLDSAVGDAIAVVTPLLSGGSRFCPRCLADHDGWQVSWRLNWTVACRRHLLLLHDGCPACGAVPRRTVIGGATPIPPATCTHLPKGSRRRCGAELTTAPAHRAGSAVLEVQNWIDQLIAELAGTGGLAASSLFADLPVVVSWLLRHQRGELQTTANRLARGLPQTLTADRGTGRRPRTGAPLTAALLIHAQTILGPDGDRATATLRSVLSSLETRRRVPPPGMSARRWNSLAPTFPNRFLRAADTDLSSLQRLRMKSALATAARPTGDVTGRVRAIPQMFWPDWSGRLLPVAGFLPELFRAAISACLLIPGNPRRDLAGVAAPLNPRVSSHIISGLLQGFADLPGSSHSQVLALLCRIADYLDEVGSPIDYQRRREQIPAAPLGWHQWRALACSAGAHPGDRPDQGRHLHAQRHLHQLLSGADLADRRHQLAFRDPGDRNRFVDFAVSLTPALRRALRAHATSLLADLGIAEPLTWSPPAELAEDLVDLPGIDTDTLDMDTVSRLVVDEHRPLGDAAVALGVHIEHIRIALERLDRPQRQWSRGAVPNAWLREQQAAQLFTRDFFEREYLQRGRRLKEIAEETGFDRKTIARFAKQAGITLAKAATPFPIDPAWLREQYCDRHRSTAEIATELGTTQMTVNRALRRLGVPLRPQGVAGFPQMNAVLAPHIPADVRAAVEGSLHGWHRLRRFQIAMQFPNQKTAASYLNANQNALVKQLQRLEHDIGEPLFHRSAFAKPQRPTTRGHALLHDLQNDRVQASMNAALRGSSIPPMPGSAVLAQATESLTTRRPPGPMVPFDDIPVERIRVGSSTLTLLRHLLDHPGEEFYGAQIRARTGLDQGTLYPLLNRLKQARWLTSRLEDDQSWLDRAPNGCGPGRRRTYYTLTPDGHRAATYEVERRAVSRGLLQERP
ncbi:TniQ family protein [Acrocarpospora macrocephala]|uniref:Uncharacterized protein n=1 Tax=Acrocarpospora macrocephala TaxID=150177 RepID=A0A5M3WW53_9ACTN|nr:TniQ family protein [Acrocarpospora macrocephala]GES10388.1 hypothetical protein Amac_039850 [Acrocarpospora macrocephala]